ncbi:hypothetical protein N007_20785 [Alicyclobacillus acidoterrestris ATCC 49025]|nr:hypothetical protein N007_20785 [Alicyclobacillus acidoterrestris ATCC 49025]
MAAWTYVTGCPGCFCKSVLTVLTNGVIPTPPLKKTTGLLAGFFIAKSPEGALA